jgi:hypothetical protein
MFLILQAQFRCIFVRRNTGFPQLEASSLRLLGGFGKAKRLDRRDGVSSADDPVWVLSGYRKVVNGG